MEFYQDLCCEKTIVPMLHHPALIAQSVTHRWRLYSLY